MEIPSELKILMVKSKYYLKRFFQNARVGLLRIFRNSESKCHSEGILFSDFRITKMFNTNE